MKDTSQFTEEQIKRYKIITEEKAQAEIDKLLLDKNMLEKRVAKLTCIAPETIFIERIDYRERGQMIAVNEKRVEFSDANGKKKFDGGIASGKFDRQQNSVSARVLKVSDVDFPEAKQGCVEELTRSMLFAGKYIVINAEAPYCPNILDWEFGGKYDDLYKAIAIVQPCNILYLDEEQNNYDYYKLSEDGIVKRQEASVDTALYLIGEKVVGEVVDEVFDKSELRTSLFGNDDKVTTAFKGLPTPKFHERG